MNISIYWKDLFGGFLVSTQKIVSLLMNGRFLYFMKLQVKFLIFMDHSDAQST